LQPQTESAEMLAGKGFAEMKKYLSEKLRNSAFYRQPVNEILICIFQMKYRNVLYHLALNTRLYKSTKCCVMVSRVKFFIAKSRAAADFAANAASSS
jgi:hypothetical protein